MTIRGFKVTNKLLPIEKYHTPMLYGAGADSACIEMWIHKNFYLQVLGFHTKWAAVRYSKNEMGCRISINYNTSTYYKGNLNNKPDTVTVGILSITNILW